MRDPCGEAEHRSAGHLEIEACYFREAHPFGTHKLEAIRWFIGKEGVCEQPGRVADVDRAERCRKSRERYNR